MRHWLPASDASHLGAHRQPYDHGLLHHARRRRTDRLRQQKRAQVGFGHVVADIVELHLLDLARAIEPHAHFQRRRLERQRRAVRLLLRMCRLCRLRRLRERAGVGVDPVAEIIVEAARSFRIGL